MEMTNKSNVAFGGVFVLLGVLLILAPRTLFPVCEYEGLHMILANEKTVPMRCYWTAQAELGLAILLVANGVLLVLLSNTGGSRFAAAMAVGIGVIVILLPTSLIGMCMSPKMPCNVGTKPALVLLGVLTIIAGGIGLSLLRPKA